MGNLKQKGRSGFHSFPFPEPPLICAPDLQSFREALAVLQRQVDELDELKASHYQAIVEHEEEVWDFVQGKVCLVVRSTLDVFDRFTSKAYVASHVALSLWSNHCLRAAPTPSLNLCSRRYPTPSTRTAHPQLKTRFSPSCLPYPSSPTCPLLPLAPLPPPPPNSRAPMVSHQAKVPGLTPAASSLTPPQRGQTSLQAPRHRPAQRQSQVRPPQRD